ncbi:putative cytochrome-c oxidase chain VI precursor [Serendipita vermifera]|nr:putative cytochrome-c oxidase chain VI precursor [Serendipita vermifera]
MLRARLQPTARAVIQTSRLQRAARPIPTVVFQTRLASAHAEETFEQFTDRYTTFFGGVQDIFELQRGLNNCFAYDLVPSPEIIKAALKAARRVNDYSTAVRIFEGLAEKVENRSQYEQYLAELKDVKEELGVATHEELWGKSKP